MSLPEFLLGRIAEDEAVARAAGIPEHTGAHKPHPELMRWRYNGEDEVEVDYDDPYPYPEKFYVTCDHEGLIPAVDPPQGSHIARFDPERILIECEAKRLTVGLLQADSTDPGNAMRREWAAEILRALAVVYADHPDYREEWRP